jgi:type I restriction enzyme S subunit
MRNAIDTIDLGVTTTGGRDATTRHIPANLALAVGMPSTPAPEGWQWAALTKLARLESGHTPSRQHPEYWGGSIPWMGIRDAKANHGKRIWETEENTNPIGIANSSARVLPKDTVCLSRTASVGYVVVLGKPMATSQDFVNWVCSEQLNPDFLKYLLIAEGKDILRFASGSVHQTIYFPEVKAFHICYPSLPEQDRIVGILVEAFDYIATAKANAEANRQNVRALFESHLQSIFTRGGEGWATRRLADVAESISTGPFGTMLHKADYVPDGIPLVNPMNIIDSRIVPSGRMMVNEKTRDRLSAYILKPGDVVIGRRGELGRCAVVTSDEAGYLCGTGSFFLRLSEKMEGRFFVALFSSRQFRERLEGSAVGTTMNSLNHTILKELPIPVPPVAEQRSIMVTADKMMHAVERLEAIYQRKLASLDALKQSLLHQAFTGAL